MKHSETLMAARELISEEKDWAQGVYAMNDNGEEVSPTNPYAICFCASGAIAKIAKKFNSDAHCAFNIFTSWIERFNDNHTHTEVLEVFYKSIMLAQFEENLL